MTRNLEKKETEGYLTHTQRAFENRHQIDFVSAPDFTSLDTPEDILKEKVLNGEPIEETLAGIVEGAVEAERREFMADLLLKILMIIGNSKNPFLEIEVLIEATGLPLREGKSQTEIAESFGITRAAFSARVQKMLKQFKLNPPRTCKRKSTQATYRLTNCTK